MISWLFRFLSSGRPIDIADLSLDCHKHDLVSKRLIIKKNSFAQKCLKPSYFGKVGTAIQIYGKQTMCLGGAGFNMCVAAAAEMIGP